jgi:UDP-N-acetylglucosamine 2-epimerase (non-hydrolysing)
MKIDKQMKKIVVIIGTRPEAIKLCPLILEMRKHNQFEVYVCVTGQHRTMLDQVLSIFEVKADIDFNLMEPNQTLANLSAKAINAIGDYLSKSKPDLVIVQGDTTTAFCGALAAFYNKIPVAHVEAGLRTGNKYSPFPEEINRKLITHIADYHFAPTELSRNNLLKEGVSEENVFVTGNTVIDALYFAIEKVKTNPPQIPGLAAEIVNKFNSNPMVLITGHRRENFGEGFENICTAIKELAIKFPETEFVYPVHLNPNVRQPVFKILTGYKNIHLIEPLEYLPFVYLLSLCKVVLTDSGGIQEEAPSLGKPVLVMRDTTERPEGVEAGTVKLVGTDKSTIVNCVSVLFNDRIAYSTLTQNKNPYGTGHTCTTIVEILQKMSKLCY